MALYPGSHLDLTNRPGKALRAAVRSYDDGRHDIRLDVRQTRLTGEYVYIVFWSPLHRPEQIVGKLHGEPKDPKEVLAWMRESDPRKHDVHTNADLLTQQSNAEIKTMWDVAERNRARVRDFGRQEMGPMLEFQLAKRSFDGTVKTAGGQRFFGHRPGTILKFRKRKYFGPGAAPQ